MAVVDEEPSHLGCEGLYIRTADFLDELNIVATCRADFPLARRVVCAPERTWEVSRSEAHGATPRWSLHLLASLARCGRSTKLARLGVGTRKLHASLILT
jgi:hypothetical protein